MAQLVIAGYGYVGSAVGDALNGDHDLRICDPALNNSRVYDYPDAEGVILCLPTPEAEDGSCDVSYLDAVLKDCYPDIPILIKSTMSIEGYEYLKKQHYNLNLNYSPEFLTAANAKEDFRKQEYIYIAGDASTFWASVFAESFPKSSILVSPTIKELILVKYFRNCYLSLKVAWANQMYDICEKLGAPYEEIQKKFGRDPRIGMSHTQVPGPDGSRGFGGACFPKDTAALLHTAERYGWDMSILEAAVKYNNKIRKD